MNLKKHWTRKRTAGWIELNADRSHRKTANERNKNQTLAKHRNEWRPSLIWSQHLDTSIHPNFFSYLNRKIKYPERRKKKDPLHLVNPNKIHDHITKTSNKNENPLSPKTRVSIPTRRMTITITTRSLNTSTPINNEKDVPREGKRALYFYVFWTLYRNFLYLPNQCFS